MHLLSQDSLKSCLSFLFGPYTVPVMSAAFSFTTVEMSVLQRQLSGVSAGESIPDAAALLRRNVVSQSVTREMMTQNNLLIGTHIRKAWQLQKVCMKETLRS